MSASCDEPERATRLWPALEAVALLLYVVAATVYALSLPYGTAPDEDGHAQYVESLAHGRGLPAPSSEIEVRETAAGRVYLTPQAHHPPAYYLLMVPVYLATGGTSGAFYPVARLLSVLLGLVALLLVRAAGLAVFADRREVVALGLCIALAFGTYSLIMGTVNNEAPAAVVVCLSVLLCSRFLTQGSALRAALVLGAVLGLGLLTKLTASVAVFPMLVAVFAATRRRSPGRWWRLRAIGMAAIGLAVALAMASPWFAHNLRTHGAPVYNSAHRPILSAPSDIVLYPEVSGIMVCLMLEEVAWGSVIPDWLVHRYTPRIAYHAFEPVATTQPRPPWHDVLMLAFWALPLWGLSGPGAPCWPPSAW